MEGIVSHRDAMQCLNVWHSLLHLYERCEHKHGWLEKRSKDRVSITKVQRITQTYIGRILEEMKVQDT